MPMPAPELPPEALRDAPDGIAVIDRGGRFVAANPAAVALCGPAYAVGGPSPFPPVTRVEPERADAGPAVATSAEERLATWEAAGERREFAYRESPLASGERVVVFRDVTGQRGRQRRLEAIASVAARVATGHSLERTLEALAAEVLAAEAIAAVQVLTVDDSGERFHVMGAAGFPSTPDFFDRLQACEDAGAELRIVEAFATRRPVVVPHRYASIMVDPAWTPVRDVMRDPPWDWFASLPMMVRDVPVGVLNAYFAPGVEVGPAALDFLQAMATQAAQAARYAALLDRERSVAAQEERQRLARDLHDSVVQRVFSMGMQAETLKMRAGREGLDVVDAAVVQDAAGELAEAAGVVLKDLRAMVNDLHQAPFERQGLLDALDDLAHSVGARTGLDVRVGVDDPDRQLDALPADLADDAYRVIAEAVQNSLKHADGHEVRIHVQLSRRGAQRWLVAEVRDDGRGLPAGPPAPGADGGFGMTTMRERARRWGGGVTVSSAPGAGTAVRLAMLVPVRVPTARRPGPGTGRRTDEGSKPC